MESVIGAYALSRGLDYIFPTFNNLGFEFGVPVDFQVLPQLGLPDLAAYSNRPVAAEQATSFERLTSYRFTNQALFAFAIVSDHALIMHSNTKYRLGDDRLVLLLQSSWTIP